MADNIPTLPCISDKYNDNIDNVLESYFLCGFTYLEIKEFLKIYHNISVSLSTIKRHLKGLSLVRRPLIGRRATRQEVERLVRCEVASSGANVGYRRIWAHLRKKGIIARREDVRLSILAADPMGVLLRRRKKLQRRKYCSPGPNHVWHIDGHDKLKPYGFCIHGCIDGFSRRLLWLNVSSSNKKPELVASYYLNAARHLGCIPRKIKADDGTEHSLIEPIHVSLRELSGERNVLESFSIVSSPLNQRIESFWSKLKQDRIGWWQQFFRDMVDLDILEPSNPVVLDCVQYCFMALIRQELKDIADEWNQHLISKSVNGGPSGRPDTMYFLPHLYDCVDHAQPVPVNEIDEFSPIMNSVPLDYSSEFKEFAELVMSEGNLEMPSNVYEGLNLYIYLLNKIADYSNM